jgi:hypothetical protein
MSTIPTPVRSAAQRARVDHPTGTAVAGVSASLVVVLLWLWPALPAEVAVAIVGLVGALVSRFTPRFASAQALLDNDPSRGGTGPDAD